MTAPRSTIWDDFPELIEQVRQGLEKGLPFSTIARLLGHGITRNAVSGKARRLELLQKREPMSAAPRAPRGAGERIRTKPPRVHVSSNPRGWPVTVVQDAYIDLGPTMADIDIPAAQRKTLMQLGAADCRWPVGDPHEPGFFFCGGPVVEDKPYCAHHCRRATTGFTGEPRAHHVGY